MIISKVCGGRALRIVVGITVLAILLAGGTMIACALSTQTSSGFVYPIDSPGPYTYAGWLAGGPEMPPYTEGYYHLGQDMEGNVGDNVYAITDGEIVYVSVDGWGDGNYGLLVKHRLNTGEEFLALYGHVRPNREDLMYSTSGPVDVPVLVGAGEAFAQIGPYDTIPHLHFGIHPGSEIPASPWGRLTVDQWPATNDFVDPIDWITTRTPHNIGLTPRSGGPDYFGYTFKDSNMAGGPAYDWVDITSTGTMILPESDDEYVDGIPVGFFFNFYGTDYSQVSITNNGLTLASGGTWEYSNQPISSSGPHNFIAPFWDDIVTWGSAGAVYYQTMGEAPNRKFVVEWYDNQHYSSSPSGITFEAILYEGTNDIKFQYKDVDFGEAGYNNGESATVGIEGSDGRGLQYSYDEPALNANLAILFKFPAFSGTNMYVSKNAPASMDHGNLMTYTLYYNNFGSTISSNVALEDTLPSNVEFISASDSGTYNSATRKVTWNIGSVDVFPSGRGSRNVTVRIPSSVPVGTVIQNIASITTTTLETRYDDNSASVSTTVTGSNLPPGVSVGPTLGNSAGTPAVYWGNPTTYSYQSSPTATGVDITIHIDDGGPDITGSMTGGPTTWTYTAPSFYPRHGTARVTYTVNDPALYSSSFDVQNMRGFEHTITATDIENYIRETYPNSPMLAEGGIGERFISAGINNHVNPTFLVATAIHEGNFGTGGWAVRSGSVTTPLISYNTMGWGVNDRNHDGRIDENDRDWTGNDRNMFNSWGEGIDLVAQRIGASNGPYYGRGLYTVDDIRIQYAGNPAVQSIVDYMNALAESAGQAEFDENFNIYIDPAGYIYDAGTGARISGASVWLQRPDGEGGWENVLTGQIPAISLPDENPLITNAAGQYQWDVLTGSYRVHVEATGYYPADSIVVSIPPPVYDLHVGLTHLPDSTPPVITNITATSTINSALIAWDTDEASTSLVKYGTSSGNYLLSASDSVMVLSHSVTLTSLDPDTLYYYVVNSTDSSGNSAQSSEHTVRTLMPPDITPPVIESVTLYPVNATAGATINISVNASDDRGVAEVRANGSLLSNSNGFWNGSIIAPSSVGSYAVTIRANDSAGNSAERIASYMVVKPTGGLGVGISPMNTVASAPVSMNYNVRIKSTENIDDIIALNVSMDGLSSGNQMPLTWFNWTEKKIILPAGGEKIIPLTLNIPSGTSGKKVFRVKANSTLWTPKAQGSTIITIS